MKRFRSKHRERERERSKEDDDAWNFLGNHKTHKLPLNSVPGGPLDPQLIVGVHFFLIFSELLI